MAPQTPPRQVCMVDHVEQFFSSSSETSTSGSDEDDDADLDADLFFARGPTTPCPVMMCPYLLCKIYLRDPVTWCTFPCNFGCDPTLFCPCASNEARFASIFRNIRRLAEAAPWDAIAMQRFTDIPITMPCLGCCCHQVFGSGVDLSPASADVMPKGLVPTFSERGLWLWPRGQGRKLGRCSLAKDCCHRCSFCCCCCVGALGGCDGSLHPPLPAENPQVIMFIHGGAFALTNAETYPWLIGYELVRRTGSVLLVPDYTRPPDVAFGSAGDPVSDCLRLYKKLVGFYGAKGILVMGDSAGGNIALATLLRAVKEGLEAPAGLVLISPWVNLTEEANDSESWHENKELDYLPGGLLQVFARTYCSGNCEDPLVSPVRADIEWLRKLPPTMLQYGTIELLRSQQEELHRNLEQAGVLKSVYIAQDMPHVSPLFAAVVWGKGTPAEKPLPPAVEALERIQEFAASVGFEPYAE